MLRPRNRRRSAASREPARFPDCVSARRSGLASLLSGVAKPASEAHALATLSPACLSAAVIAGAFNPSLSSLGSHSSTWRKPAEAYASKSCSNEASSVVTSLMQGESSSFEPFPEAASVGAAASEVKSNSRRFVFMLSSSKIPCQTTIDQVQVMRGRMQQLRHAPFVYIPKHSYRPSPCVSSLANHRV